MTSRRYEQNVLPQTTLRQQLRHLFVVLHILSFHQPMSNRLLMACFIKNNFMISLYLTTSHGETYEQECDVNYACLTGFFSPNIALPSIVSASFVILSLDYCCNGRNRLSSEHCSMSYYRNQSDHTFPRLLP